ncbi:hypothetical protein ONZ45_g10193 [Pleurotus djamor]|nr:hypothetical protein ONZ45_g10193 [Pleurotus djamor]
MLSPERRDSGKVCAFGALIGIYGDLGANTIKFGDIDGDWPVSAEMILLGDAAKNLGKKKISDAVSLLNAPRRTPEYDVELAWNTLLHAHCPADILGSKELCEMKVRIREEVERCSHMAPQFSQDGQVALLRIDSPYQIHPLIATRWPSTLKGKKLMMVMVSNPSHHPDPSVVSFSCRITGEKRKLPDNEQPDLISLLKMYGERTDETFMQRVGGDFAKGHKQATGGIISKPNRLGGVALKGVEAPFKAPVISQHERKQIVYKYKCGSTSRYNDQPTTNPLAFPIPISAMPSTMSSSSRRAAGAPSPEGVSSIPRVHSPLNPAPRSPNPSPIPNSASSISSSAATSRVFSDSPKSGLLTPPTVQPLLPSPVLEVEAQQISRPRPRGQSTSNIPQVTEKAQQSVDVQSNSKRLSYPAPIASSGVRRDLSVDNIASHDGRDAKIGKSNYPSESDVQSLGQSRSALASHPQSNPRGRSVSITPRLETQPKHGKASKGGKNSRSRSPDSSIIELPGMEGVDGVSNSGIRPGEPVPGHLGSPRLKPSASLSSSPSHSTLGLPDASPRHDYPPSYPPKPFGEATYRSVTSVDASRSTVWGGDKKPPRPWHGPSQTENLRTPNMEEWEKIRDGSRMKEKTKEKIKDIPEEQEEGWLATRNQVASAAKSILSTAGDVTHELLELGVDYLGFAPVPGLQTAAKTLLQIWDALQAVDLNRMACLGLVQDCASSVLAIRDEILNAGVSVMVETDKPFAELNAVFVAVKDMLESIAEMSFLKRYLKRDDVTRQINGCHKKLDKALMHFDNSIMLRVLKHVMSTREHSEEMRVMVEKIYTKEMSSPVLQSHGIPPSLSAATSHQSSIEPGSEAWSVVNDVRTRMRDVDNAFDMADLRRLMQAALQAGSDAEMIRTLQVGRDSMPEAIKALQRELDHEKQREYMIASGSALTQQGTSTLMGNDPRIPKVTRRVSVTNVPVPLKVDDKGDFILEDVIDASAPEDVLTPSVASPTQVPSVQTPPTEQLHRSRTVVSIESVESGFEEQPKPKDTLDREFMEGGLDALRRMSKGIDKTLPSWTITEFEIFREEQIGVGFFSEVYKGTWRNRTVAIKQLHRGTPQRPFVREVEIWKTLKHSNVLKLLGASTPSTPPYFLVSPYMKNGSLVEFLSRVARGREIGVLRDVRRLSPIGSGLSRGSSLSRSPSPSRRGRGSPGGGAGIGGWRMLSLPPSSSSGASGASGTDPGHLTNSGLLEPNLVGFMYEIAKGMEYLHENGVLHGDLKAANVLVNDRLHCVITDFGQSEMKSEAYRMSGTKQPRGTLRWQAPELMQGASALTAQMDVYAFAITCVEVLNMGKLPWSLMDDDSVRYFVLKENNRPPLPASRYVTPQFEDLLRQAWHHDPSHRPQFHSLVPNFKQMTQAFARVDETLSPSMSDQFDLDAKKYPSPDMRPISLPFPHSSDGERTFEAHSVSPAPSDDPFDRAAGPFNSRQGFQYTPTEEDIHRHGGPIRMPQPEPTPFVPPREASDDDDDDVFVNSASETPLDNFYHYEGYDTPPPLEERLKQIRNERRYRMLLTHDFHPSLTLPLWNPSPVALGAVGYLMKPQGSFVTLFNATNPLNSAGLDMASLKGYGDFTTGKQRDNKRHLPQRVLDSLTNIFKSSNEHVRKYTFPLRAGHRHAYLCAETTQYRYFEDLDTPKKWFKSNVDTILELYGAQHDIQKEDLFLVIGSLSAPDYGLFAHFNIFGSQKAGHPWGRFTTDTASSQDNGPSYSESETPEPQVASKVSIVGNGPWDSLLIAKLRFRPDIAEPTSL